MASFAPSTWRLLGLSVAACYAGFGLFEIVFPVRSARDLFQIPVLPAKKEGKPLPAGSESVHPAAATTGSEDVVPTLMPLLGARDV